MAGQDDLELTMANLDEVTQELRADAGPGDPRQRTHFVIASMGGAPKNPARYGNLVARPKVTVEVRGESYAALALVMAGAERDSLFAEAARKIPQFAEYQKRTTRLIPMVELQRLT